MFGMSCSESKDMDEGKVPQQTINTQLKPLVTPQGPTPYQPAAPAYYPQQPYAQGGYMPPSSYPQSAPGLPQQGYPVADPDNPWAAPQQQAYADTGWKEYRQAPQYSQPGSMAPQARFRPMEKQTQQKVQPPQQTYPGAAPVYRAPYDRPEGSSRNPAASAYQGYGANPYGGGYPFTSPYGGYGAVPPPAGAWPGYYGGTW